MQLSLPKGNDLVEILRNLKEKGPEMDPDTLIDYLSKEIRTFPLVNATIPKGALIERSRRNIGEDLFSSENQISYRRDLVNINHFGRCNAPGVSIFYGLMPTQELPHARVACVFETNEYFRDPNKGDTEFYQTVGRWRVMKSFDVIEPILVGSPGYTPFFNAIAEEHPERVEDLRMVVDFMSHEFTKSEIPTDKDYKISAAFSEMVIKKAGSNGLLYPSVRTDYKGMCIALNPSIVDVALQLETVGNFKVYKRGKNAVMDNHSVATDIGPKNTQFNWTSVETMDEAEREKILNS